MTTQPSDDKHDKLDPEIEKIIRDMCKDAYWRGVEYGGKFIVKTLRETMQFSGLEKVEPRWLDIADEELNQITKQS